MSRLLERYRKEVLPQLVADFGFQNPMQAPRLEKVVLSIGMGEAIKNPKALEAAQKDLETISGQKPVVTRARRSIAAFKLRTGMPIGLMVTLRGKRMYYFLDKLMNAVLPRIRDFQGVPQSSFDGQGNYSLGLREQVIFPEVDYDKIDRIRGLEVSVITSATTDEEGRRLLELLGMPFQRS